MHVKKNNKTKQNKTKTKTEKWKSVKSSFFMYMVFRYTNIFIYPPANKSRINENGPSVLLSVLISEKQNWHYLFIHLV